MAAEYQLTLHDYLEIVRRRAKVMLAVFAAVLAISVLVAVVLKPVYEASGTILVESQAVSADAVQGVAIGFVDEQIEVIRQRVLTRENLLRIVNKYGMFPNAPANMGVTEKVDELRKMISVQPLRSGAGGRGRGPATIAFKLAFESNSPETALGVANDLVTLFLNENVKSRTERATETREFLTQEAARLNKELEGMERAIAEHKRRYGSVLSQDAAARSETISRREAEFRQVERDYRRAEDELRVLMIEAEGERAGARTRATEGGRLPTDLASLRAEDKRLSAIYSESHPDRRAIRRQIAALEAAGAKPDAKLDAVEAQVPATPEGEILKARIVSARDRVSSLKEQMEHLQKRLEEYERQSARQPEAERTYIALTRDHENAQRKYAEIRAKQMNAEVAQNLVQENKAERFTLIDPPVRPEKPVRPDRVKILLVGFLASLGAPVGLAFLMESLNQRIRGSRALAAVIRQNPLGIIPYIQTREQLSARKLRYGVAALAGLVALVLAGIAAHLFYMPLDILMLKIAGRFS